MRMNAYISGITDPLAFIMSGVFFRLINDRDTTHIVISEVILSDVCVVSPFGNIFGDS